MSHLCHLSNAAAAKHKKGLFALAEWRSWHIDCQFVKLRWRKIRFLSLVCDVSAYGLGIHARKMRIQEA